MKLLKLLLLCRQYGDAATHAALEAASAVASEEANLTEIAKEMEKKKREEQLQASDKASKAEEERKLLLVEAKKAKKESESLASQAAKKMEAANAAAAARNDAVKKAAEAAEAAETAQALSSRKVASMGMELPQMDDVMILGHIEHWDECMNTSTTLDGTKPYSNSNCNIFECITNSLISVPCQSPLAQERDHGGL